MVDTARSITALKALLADNTTGAISAQDLRDAVETLQLNYGELYTSATAETSIANTSDYVDLAGTWTLGEARNFDESSANGRLTYIGTPDIEVLVFCIASLTSAGNNDVVHLRLEKTGTAVTSSDATQKLAVGNDVASMTSLGLTSMSTGDYINAAVRNETSTNNLTAQNSHLMLIGLAI